MTKQLRMLRDSGPKHFIDDEEVLTQLLSSLDELTPAELMDFLRRSKRRCENQHVPHNARLAYRAGIDAWLGRWTPQIYDSTTPTAHKPRALPD